MTQATEVLDRVLHLATLVQSDLARFEREAGLTTPRVHLLWVLGEAGPSTQQALARALAVTPRNVTGLVDGLVASGHVTREPHPTDRRATLVTPTTQGARTIRELVESHDDLARRLFGDVAPERLTTFDEVLGATVERFAGLMAAEAAR
ncbi:DNA-binding MarR family transcriptional regulator [Nocardioides sp. BE266]|uniref:MarR family winged helix-turn-helix transcriptional regulator n=1 Tax=Nocardioides sp. BE266 TaxID=2817725 RepID=UPI002865B321|nr:MarR family transcriptional regulator [Nocardioides sp. BE266]MDR7253055.1 DNA-binding MarR family transcriptional regulator [Nocardioides sp. BE266]